MAKGVNPSNARNRLLTAASRVIQRDGILALTLEAVAKEAGVSKGGLLYHFPSKDALVRGLLEYYLEQFEEALKVSLEPFPQAYVRLGLYDGSQGLTLGLITAIALNPTLLQPVRAAYSRWQQGLNTPGATIARLATDGLWLAELFGLGVPDKALKEQVLQRLLKLAKEES